SDLLHGVERMGTRESGEIDDGEEEVSELLLEGGRRLRLEGAPDLLDLFRDLFERTAPIRPVEADGADPLLDAVGAGEGVEAAGQAFEQRAALGFPRLERFPGLGGAAAVEVRVATSHLPLEFAHHVLRGEGATLFGEHDLERDVEEEVAELADERAVVAIGHG